MTSSSVLGDKLVRQWPAPGDDVLGRNRGQLAIGDALDAVDPHFGNVARSARVDDLRIGIVNHSQRWAVTP